MQYGKHFNTVKHTVEHLNDESNTPLIKAVSETKKIANFTSTKCPTPKGCEANLVYQFECQGCDKHVFMNAKMSTEIWMVENELCEKKNCT